jgi:hypothetical protein
MHQGRAGCATGGDPEEGALEDWGLEETRGIDIIGSFVLLNFSLISVIYHRILGFSFNLSAGT